MTKMMRFVNLSLEVIAVLMARELACFAIAQEVRDRVGNGDRGRWSLRVEQAREKPLGEAPVDGLQRPIDSPVIDVAAAPRGAFTIALSAIAELAGFGVPPAYVKVAHDLSRVSFLRLL